MRLYAEIRASCGVLTTEEAGGGGGGAEQGPRPVDITQFLYLFLSYLSTTELLNMLRICGHRVCCRHACMFSPAVTESIGDMIPLNTAHNQQ